MKLTSILIPFLTTIYAVEASSAQLQNDESVVRLTVNPAVDEQRELLVPLVRELELSPELAKLFSRSVGNIVPFSRPYDISEARFTGGPEDALGITCMFLRLGDRRYDELFTSSFKMGTEEAVSATFLEGVTVSAYGADSVACAAFYRAEL